MPDTIIDAIIERGPYVGPGALRLDAADLNLLRAELINLRTQADTGTPPATPYETPDGFPSTPSTLAGRLAFVVMTWETCASCKGEFVPGHICRSHRLCGTCHPAEFVNLDAKQESTQ